VVGHALHHDFKMLMLDHPRKMIRDTSLYEPFRKISKGKTPSLKRLASEELGMTIQTGRHSSVRIFFPFIFFSVNVNFLMFIYTG
jgi:RNA exonuclease 4